MHTRCFYRLYLLVIILLLSSLLAGCLGSRAETAVAGEVGNTQPVTPPTSAPTRTLAVLPPTSTPTPYVKVVLPTRTPTPTPTMTPNIPQTMAAKATANKAVECKTFNDPWEIKAKPSSFKTGWCQVNSIGGTYYEYELLYPSQWMITTFGDVYPSMAFNTGLKGVEVRIYQLYNYNIRKYEGSLEDAPLKAGFCDEKDQCTLVISPLENITNKEIRNTGGRKVLVVDSQDGKYNVRRYFFFVPFKYAQPTSNRLFILKLYTPDPVAKSNYTNLEKQIDDLIVSIRHDF